MGIHRNVHSQALRIAARRKYKEQPRTTTKYAKECGGNVTNPKGGKIPAKQKELQMNKPIIIFGVLGIIAIGAYFLLR